MKIARNDLNNQGSDMTTQQQLNDAADAFRLRDDQFARNMVPVALDLALRLEKFGSFASDKQAEFASKVISWSLPRQPEALAVPRLHGVMQRNASLDIGKLRLVRRNGDELVWVKHADYEKVVGTISEGKLKLGYIMTGEDRAAVRAAIAEIELNPLEAAKRHGQASGRCSCCGRDLTNPASIERGIGPICAGKF